MGSRVLRALGLVLTALSSLVALYGAAALVGGLWQVNRNHVEPLAGTEVWLRSNGVHVDLVLPATTPTHDWRSDFPLPAFPGAADDSRWIAFGWGARDFFVNVREWKDLTATRALRALVGERTVLHVEHLPGRGDPVPPGAGRRLRLGAAEYRRLVEHVRDSAARDAGGNVQLLPGLGYSAHDNFYEGRGHYTPIDTCNEWANAGLKRAGVRAPLWSPFAMGLVR